MTDPTETEATEAPDRAAYRTSNLEDPDLAAAYEVENELVRLDGETYGIAWLFGIVPAALVVVLLSALLGDWVWDAVPAIFIAFIAGFALLKLGLFRRYASDLPIHLPGLGTYSGPRKRKLLLKAGASVVAFIVVEQSHLLGRLQHWFVAWVTTLV